MICLDKYSGSGRTLYCGSSTAATSGTPWALRIMVYFSYTYPDRSEPSDSNIFTVVVNILYVKYMI